MPAGPSASQNSLWTRSSSCRISECCGRSTRRPPPSVLAHDALVILGTCVAPVNTIGAPGRRLAVVRLEPGPTGAVAARAGELHAGELQRWPLREGAAARLIITPEPGVDFGAGTGQTVEAWVRGGPVGLVLDGRGVDLTWPAAELARRECVRGWLRTLEALPEDLP